MRELEYPFNSEYILKNSKKLRRTLLGQEEARIKKKIAVLGGAPPMILYAYWSFFYWNKGLRRYFMNRSMGSIFRMPCSEMRNWANSGRM